MVELDRARAVAVTQSRLRLRRTVRIAAELEAQGWEAWYAEIFGQSFVDALADHHRKAIGWHWSAAIAKREGRPVEYDAYIAAWSRGHMKSTIARRIAIADACLSREGYCLYVSGTKGKVKGHALSLETLLGSEKIKQWYPRLAEVRKSTQGDSKGWTRHFIYTDQGYIFQFISLEEGVAGANVDNIRPTLIIPDDIDDRMDSPAVAEQRYQVFTREVLPTKQAQTLFFLAQNVISRFSIMYRILRQRVRLLTNRYPTKAIPAFHNLRHEVRTINGIVKDVLIAGDPTWPLYDLRRGQEDVDVYGLEAFKAECQHEVDQQKTGLILPEWDERVHIITWSQFATVYGVREIPRQWRKYVGHDWGAIHPCVVSCWATASQNSRRPGLHFVYAGLTFPQNTICDDVALSIIERLAPTIDTSPVRSLSPEIMAKWQHGRVGDILDAPRSVASEELRPKVEEWIWQSGFEMWHMSHEQKTIRRTYNATYGLPFQACNPGAAGGIDQIRHYLRTDYDQLHPFKPGEKGMAGLYFIVDDDQYYEIEGNEIASQARDDRGLKLWREQFPEWTWRQLNLTDLGLQQDKPVKFNDDAGNSLMMIAAHFGLQPLPLTDEEKIEIALPDGLKRENLNNRPPGFQRDIGEFIRDVKLSERKKEQTRVENWSTEIVDPNDDPWREAYKDPKW